MLFPHKRVGENIVFPLRMHNVAQAQQKERLGWVVGLGLAGGLAGIVSGVMGLVYYT